MKEIFDFELYKFILIFLRIGAAFMLMPGFMSSYVNTQLRLAVALTVTAIMLPVLGTQITPPPTDFATVMQIALFEITYGVFLGVFMQMLYFALVLVGNIAGQAIGFANAQIFDPTSQNQSTLIETFLAVTAVTVVFITDIHHLMISALYDSYNIFPFGSPLNVGDFSQSLSMTINKSFIIGFKISSPFIAFTIVFYIGIGLVSRLMPQLNIFFLSLPLQIYLGLSLLLITTPVIIMWFIRYYENGLIQFLR